MMWQVNLRAPAQLIHALLPKLQAACSASVINVKSIHQTVPYPHNSGYAMTKAALGMLTQTLSIELAPLGIRVNNFAPGAVETDMNREIIERMRKDFAEWIPAGRVAHTDEMIGPAVFLASDESGYVNGATLVADGGYSHNLVRYRP
jgi:gluconate 5-dehydrogenase